MTEGSEEKNYVHWRDLAQQLGAEPGEELVDYFATAKFDGPPIEEDELGPPAAPATTRPATTAAAVSDETPTTTRSQQPAAGESFDSNPQTNELEIDWSTEPHKPQPRRKATRSKPVPKVPADSVAKSEPVVESPEDQSHWNELATSLGLSPPEPSISAQAPEESEQGKVDDPEPSAFRNDDPEPSPTSVLDDMFVPLDELFDEGSASSTTDANEDVEDELDDDVTESDLDDFDDDQYVEFEIQDLHSGEESDVAERKRRPTSDRERRPRRQSKPAAQSPATDSEKEPARSRPPRSRKSRRDREKTSAEAPVTKEGSQNGDEDEKERGNRGISRNQPTWQETVDVIVEANLASRKKSQRRGRGRGRGRN